MSRSISNKFDLCGLLKFALPSIIMMLFNSFYVIVDGMFISHYVSTDAFAGINIVFPHINLFLAIGIMLGTGGGAYISKQLGENKNEVANGSLSAITIWALIIGEIIAILTFIFMTPIINFLGADESTFEYCRTYLTISLIFTPTIVLQMLFQCYFSTASKPELGLIFTVAAGVSNIVFDYIFIVILGMGVAGAAYGTVIGYCVLSAGGLFFFLKNKKGLHYGKPIMKANTILKSCGNGSSEMISNLAASIVTVIYNIILMRYIGPDGVAAFSAIGYLQFMFLSIFFGFSLGVAPVIGYHYGAGNKSYLKHLFTMSIKFVMVVSVIMVAIAFFERERLASIFSDSGTEVNNLICYGMIPFSFSFLFSGLNVFASSAYTALSDGKSSALISFMRTFVFLISVTLVLVWLFKINGLWYAITVSELLTFLLVIFITLKKRKFFV